MSFRVLVEGVPIETTTAQEALELARLARNGHETRTRRMTSADQSAQPGNEEHVFQQVLSEINERARGFLAALLRHSNGIRGEEFAEETHTESTAYGGILGGISKRANNHELAIDDFVISEFRTEGSNRFRFVQPGRLLRQYAHLLQASVGG